MILTLLVLMFYIWMIKIILSVIGWGIRIWFYILIGIFALVFNVVYYLIPIILIWMLIGLISNKKD